MQLSFPMFLLLYFPPLQNRADVSSPAFSTLAFLNVPIFPLPHFQSPLHLTHETAPTYPASKLVLNLATLEGWMEG